MYGGAVWYSFKSDNFHDFFTEYIPGSTQVIHAIEDYQFNQRYPGTSPANKGDKTSDLGRKGPHISATEANHSAEVEKKNVDVTKEKEEPKRKNEERKPGDGKSNEEEGKKGPTIQVSKTSSPPRSSEQVKEGTEKESPVRQDVRGATSLTSEETHDAMTKKSEPQPTFTKEMPESSPQSELKPAEPVAPRPKIGLLDISPNDATLEKIISALNDLIKSFNATPASDSSSAPLYEFLKSSIDELNTRLPEIISNTRTEADALVKAQAQHFAQLHQELKAAVLQERNVIAKEWMATFDREREILQERYNDRLTEELKKQGEVNGQRLETELLEQAIALRRRWMREIQSQVETERGGRLGKLANLEKALSELSVLHIDSHNVYSRNEKTKKTAIVVQAFKDAALNRGGGFIAELNALKALSKNDELVRAVVASIDPEACSKGVVSQADLATRFQDLSNELRKIALLPPDAGFAGHAASWLLSKIMFRQKGYVRGDDVDSRLARVEALLEGGQLEDATREVNSFDGWGRELSRDWLREARKRLEVVQAIDVIPLMIQTKLQVLETKTVLDALESV